jgi:hypothetical protein
MAARWHRPPTAASDNREVLVKLRFCLAVALATLPVAMAFAQSQPAGAPQSRDPAAITRAEAEAMAKLHWMDGAWRGPAVTRTAQGERKVMQTERIGPMLGGTIKVIEGRGFSDGRNVGFNAFGVVSYDPFRHAYEFRTYAQGYAGTFPLEVTPTGYVWSTPAAGGSVRYTATVKGDSWNEVGDLIAEGKPPVRIFEMNLARIGDSDWPEAGALTAN